MFHFLLRWSKLQMGRKLCWYTRCNKSWRDAFSEKTGSSVHFARSFCNKLKRAWAAILKEAQKSSARPALALEANSCLPSGADILLRNLRVCSSVCQVTYCHGCRECMAAFLLMRTGKPSLYLSDLRLLSKVCQGDFLNCCGISQQNILGWTSQHWLNTYSTFQKCERPWCKEISAKSVPSAGGVNTLLVLLFFLSSEPLFSEVCWLLKDSASGTALLLITLSNLCFLHRLKANLLCLEVLSHASSTLWNSTANVNCLVSVLLLELCQGSVRKRLCPRERWALEQAAHGSGHSPKLTELRECWDSQTLDSGSGSAVWGQGSPSNSGCAMVLWLHAKSLSREGKSHEASCSNTAVLIWETLQTCRL